MLEHLLGSGPQMRKLALDHHGGRGNFEYRLRAIL